MGSAGADPAPSSSDDDLMECQDHAGAALSEFSPVGVSRTASGHRSLLQAAEDSPIMERPGMMMMMMMMMMGLFKESL